MHRVEVAGARLTLFAPGGAVLAGWDLRDWVRHDSLHVRRSPDGAIVTVAAGEQITAVRSLDGRIVARCRAGAGVEASLPLDGRLTLELAGGLEVDGGQTGFQGGFRHTEEEAEELTPRWMAPALSRADALLWPPVPGPAGVLLRHAVTAEYANGSWTEPLRPWLIRPDGTVSELPFELGVSPLTALPDGRWLLPGLHAIWRDDFDEPVSVLDETGAVEPLLVGGRPVPVSRVLEEAAPDVLAALPAVTPPEDHPWETTGARIDPDAGELRLAIETDGDDSPSVVVAAVPLDGTAPARLIAHLVPPSGGRVAAAP